LIFIIKVNASINHALSLTFYYYFGFNSPLHQYLR